MHCEHFAFHFSEPTLLSTCLLHDKVTCVSIYLCCNQFICEFIVVTVTDCVVSPATLLRKEGSGSVCIVQLSLSPTFLVKPKSIELVPDKSYCFYSWVWL